MTDFGITIHCDDDFSPRMQAVSGVDSVAEALIRRLSTSRGGLWYDQDYGTNLCDFVNQAFSGYTIERACELESLKDERVYSCGATATIERESVSISMQIELENGNFEMVLLVTGLSVEMLELKAA